MRTDKRFLHERGREMISAYDGSFMRMNSGIVEIIQTVAFISKDNPPFVSHVDEVVAQIALGPGESVRAVPHED